MMQTTVDDVQAREARYILQTYRRAPITFVRFEPLVVPKQSLTGASTERVDTRVLQAVYRIEGAEFPLFVGQQMDVFIDASDLTTAMTTKCRSL